MTEFPKGINFKYSWRNYQKRVLSDLQSHLHNGHLHLIAPPGSGKTVLGLEVAIRLNKPTLILAPTITIRDQWIQRFYELFLQTNIRPDWISVDVRNPKFFTVATYQALHAACSNRNNDFEEIDIDLDIDAEEDVEDEKGNENETENDRVSNLDNIINGLLLQKVKTIVVDEAHHLRNEWWVTLTKVKERLDPVVVGLTATPPYDVTAAEWQRYIALNGSVDSEISVPELVIEGDLCPHQDYVYFSYPTIDERQIILEFRNNIERIFQEIKNDETIINAIEHHSIWINPTENLEWIYNNLPFYSASLIFLNANGCEIPESHLEIIGEKKIEIPPLDYQWMELVLEFYLYHGIGQFEKYSAHQHSLENKLRRYGAIEKRKINFSYNRKITGILKTSASKLQGIKEIVDFEYQKLGSTLRLVILSDFIRKEFYVNASENILELNKIGVIPIFEQLRRENQEDKKIGVLTGSMVIIPVSAYLLFQERATQYGISKINANAVPYDRNYVLINQTEQIKNIVVHLITQIFQEGGIEVLIGTKSLLGEGWDAPAINSLILASFVGSFVTSNQMRGRAIRTQKGNAEKTANIWHLACIDSTSPIGGDDFDLLKRRFRSFVGISYKENQGIENGLSRLNLSDAIFHKEVGELKNKEMFLYAGDRGNLKMRWKNALANGVCLVEEVKIPFGGERGYNSVKSMYFNKTIKNLLVSLGFGFFSYGLEVLQVFGRSIKVIKSVEGLHSFLFIFGLVGVILFGGMTYKTFKLFLKYRDISKDIQKIGEAILSSFIKAGVIGEDYSKLRVDTSIDPWGAVYCHLEGGTTYDKSTFINALQEVISPIGNPRYIIVRKSRFLGFLQKRDYHAVPELLGRNKNLSEYFVSQWRKYVGDAELIFTRSIEGRKFILKSRIKSLSGQLNNNIERVNKWK